MNPSFPLLVLLSSFLLVAGCNGPAFPQRDSRAYLERKNYSRDTIEAVLNLKPLPHDQIVTFHQCGSADVRFLVGSNPTLTAEEIDLFLCDPDDYARSGTAYNTSLTSAQIERLFHDRSHLISCGLAGNPAVPAPILLKLHRERRPGLVFFAMNPACPPEIMEKIRTSGDGLAKHWLEMRHGSERTGRCRAPSRPHP